MQIRQSNRNVFFSDRMLQIYCIILHTINSSVTHFGGAKLHASCCCSVTMLMLMYYNNINPITRAPFMFFLMQVTRQTVLKESEQDQQSSTIYKP